MRPFCRQAARTPVQLAGSTGARQRSAPTGGWAKGTPFHDQVPLRALSSTPSSLPKEVVRSSGPSSSDEPPHAASTRPAARAAAAQARDALGAREVRSLSVVVRMLVSVSGY